MNNTTRWLLSLFRRTKWMFVLIGTACVVTGTTLFYDSEFCSLYYGYCVDLSGYNIPLAIFMECVGLCSLWVAFRGKPDNTFLMCPYCEQSYRWDEVKKRRCPECGATLEPLVGFYGRHPELAPEKKGGTGE